MAPVPPPPVPHYTHEWVFDREYDKLFKFPIGVQAVLHKGDGSVAWQSVSGIDNPKAESMVTSAVAREQIELDTDNEFLVQFGTATDTLVPFSQRYRTITKTWPDDPKRYLTHSPNMSWRWSVPIAYLPGSGSVVELDIVLACDISPTAQFNTSPDHPHEQLKATISFLPLFDKVENLISYAYETDATGDKSMYMIHMLWRGVVKPNLPSQVQLGLYLVPQLENVNEKHDHPELLPLDDNTFVTLTGWVTISYLYTTLRPYSLHVPPTAHQIKRSL